MKTKPLKRISILEKSNQENSIKVTIFLFVLLLTEESNLRHLKQLNKKENIALSRGLPRGRGAFFFAL